MTTLEIKWSNANYVLPTTYGTQTDAEKNAWNKAMNMIALNTNAGQCLAGKWPGIRINFTNPDPHTGTDNAGLGHVNFTFNGTFSQNVPNNKGGVYKAQGDHAPAGSHHLYPNGNYTTPVSFTLFEGDPHGNDAAQAAYDKATTKEAPKVPSADAFPSLGEGGKGKGK